MSRRTATPTLGPWAFILIAGLFVLATEHFGFAVGAPLTFLIPDTVMGLTFVVAGAVAWLRRPLSRIGPILVLCAVLWSLGSYSPTQLVPFWVIGFAFEGYYDVAFGYLAVTFPAQRLRGAAAVAVAVLGGAFAARSLGRLLLQDPPRTYPEAFLDGPINPFAVFEQRAAFETVEIVTSVAVALAAGAVVVIAVRRLLRSPGLTRAVIGPVLVATCVAMSFAVLDGVETAWSTATGSALIAVPEAFSGLLSWVGYAGRVLVPIGFLVGILRLRRAGGPLADLATQMERNATPDEVDEALRAYIENDQLADRLIAQLAELRSSRARLVSAGDAERQRIERALHDGAQQHLTGIAIRLEEARLMAGIQPDALVQKLEETATELRDAINELRELARGIHPTILAEAGLGPALATLARRSPIPVDLRVDLDGRLPQATEVTAYYVVAEGLTNVARSARATRAEVSVELSDGGLAVAVRDDGIGGAHPGEGSGIGGLRDRVRALNGRFEIDSPPGHGTELKVWLPCE
jgi:signal transduction histidine kinase